MASTWLVARLRHSELPLARFAAEHGGCAIDLVAEPAQAAEGGSHAPALFLVRRAPAAAVDGLLAELEPVHGPVAWLRRDPAAQVWAGRLGLPAKALDDTTLQALVRLRDRFGTAWLHLEGGVVRLLARAREGTDPARAAREVQGYLDARGIEAQVSVREVPEDAIGPWQSLVERPVAA